MLTICVGLSDYIVQRLSLEIIQQQYQECTKHSRKTSNLINAAITGQCYLKIYLPTLVSYMFPLTEAFKIMTMHFSTYYAIGPYPTT